MNGLAIWLDQLRYGRKAKVATEKLPIGARVRRLYVRWKFGAGKRRNFYAAMSNYLASGRPLRSALEIRQKIYSEESGEGAGLAVVTNILSGIGKEGEGLAAAMKPWVSPSEASVVAAAERSGGDVFSEVFKRLVKTMDNRAKLVKAAWAPMSYGAMLLLIDVGMLVGFVLVGLPTLLHMTPLEKMADEERTFVGFLQFFHDFGVLVGIAMLGIVAFVAGTIGRYTRVSLVGRWLYRMPPYSIYRTYQESVFLQNLKDLLVTNTPQVAALQIIASTNARYISFRVNDIRERLMRHGSNLGKALLESPYRFPDRETVYFIDAAVGSPNFKESVDSFANGQFEMHLESIGRVAKWANVLCFVITGLWGLFVIYGLLGMVSNAFGQVDTQ